MLRIALLHARLQITISLLLAILVLWGLVCALRSRVGQGYLVGLAIAQLLLMSQALLGLLLIFGNTQPARFALHIVYGIVGVTCLPGVYFYNGRRTGRWEALTYAGVTLFLLGIVIRSFETGA